MSEVNQEIKTWEDELRSKLSKIKIGETIKAKDSPFELGETAKFTISGITRLSETKFKINRTIGGRIVLDEDSYFTIEANQKISGNLYDEGFKTYIGYKIKVYNVADKYLQHVGDLIANPIFIVGDYGFFYKDKTTIGSFKL